MMLLVVWLVWLVARVCRVVGFGFLGARELVDWKLWVCASWDLVWVDYVEFFGVSDFL